MREGWEMKKLGEVATVLYGFPFNSKLFTNDEQYMPLIRIRDLKNGKSDTYYKGDYLDDYVVRNGDYLIGMDGEFNIVEWEGGNALLNQRVCRVDTCNSSLLRRFLFKYLPIPLKQIEETTPFVTVKHLSSKKLLQIEIPIPSLSEQHRIVSELDCLSGIIEKKREQLKELDNLAQAVFYEMFGDPIRNEKGWEIKTIKENVTEMFIGPFGSSLKTDCYVDKTDAYCMVYEQKHAIRKNYNLDNHYVGKDKYLELKRFSVHSGDFIMSCRGTIGEIYRIPSDAPMGIIHPSLMKIRLKDNTYNPVFFEKVLQQIIKEQSVNGGCVKMAITAKSLGMILAIFPPIQMQNLFAEKIAAMDRQKTLIQQSLSEVENLFHSRMDNYFG